MNKLKKNLFLLQIVLICLNVYPNDILIKTKMGKLVDSIQNQFVKSTQYPIIIFDRDELGWRYAISRAFDENKKNKRIQIIKEYVYEQLGVMLEDSEIENYELFITNLRGSALAQPSTIADEDGTIKFTSCGVFPSSYNSNKRLSNERMVGMPLPSIYGEMDYHNIKSPLSYDENIYMSIYHELGHCHDTRYMLDARSMWSDASNIHMAESFAEVFMLQMLNKRGYKNLALRRSIIRSIYSRKMGQHLAGGSVPSFDDSLSKGGAIYYLSPVIDAFSKLEEALIDFKDKDTSFIIKQSYQLVSEFALDYRTIGGIYTFLSNGEETAINYMRELFERLPELFLVPTIRLKNYIEDTNVILEDNLLLIPTIPNAGEELINLDLELFCKAYIMRDKVTFFNLLDQYRDNLIKVRSDEDKMSDRSKFLDDIFLEVSTKCEASQKIKPQTLKNRRVKSPFILPQVE